LSWRLQAIDLDKLNFKLMIRYGLKLWSHNQEYIPLARRLFAQGIYNFIELYVVPDTYKKYIQEWKKLKIPVIIHCTHSEHGFNPAKRGNLKNNLKLFSEVRRFCDELDGAYIIFHPGIEGNIEETIKQVCLFNEKRLLVENKPFVSFRGQRCRGSTYQELNSIIENCKVGFCMDIAHAVNTAFHLRKDPYVFIKQLARLKPNVIHISDAKYSGIHDEHLNIGKGELDFKKICAVIANTSAHFLTVETDKKKPGFKDFILDVLRIKDFMSGRPDLNSIKFRKKNKKHVRILFLTNNPVSKPLVVWLREKAKESILVTGQRLDNDLLQRFKPDFLISYNYRYIIKDDVLNILMGRAINLHIAYLPWNRGAHPNLWSILDNTPKGVTIHHMIESLDAGAIIAQKKVIFCESRETLASSYALLHKEIQKLFMRRWQSFKEGKIVPFPQQGMGSIHYVRDFERIKPLLRDRGWDIKISELKSKYKGLAV